MKFLFLLLLAVAPIQFAFGDDIQKVDGPLYAIAGTAVELHDRVTNPHDYEISASIEFVFENVYGNNHWDDKKHTGMAAPEKNFVAHQAYFLAHPGKFYSHTHYGIDGVITENPYPAKFIVIEKESKAVVNGCSDSHEVVVKPDYSEAVCVFDGTASKLALRGWLVD